MNPKIVLRSETDADVSAIADVTIAAFRTLEISNRKASGLFRCCRSASGRALATL